MIGRCFTISRNPRNQFSISRNRREASNESAAQEEAVSDIGAYGLAYQSGPETLSVIEPGGIVPVLLSNSAPLKMGVTHEPGAAEVIVSFSGDYEIRFALYISADKAGPATFSLQGDGKNIESAVWDIPLKSGFQIVNGFTIAHIGKNVRVRVVMTAASPLNVRLTGSNTTASLVVKKI